VFGDEPKIQNKASPPSATFIRCGSGRADYFTKKGFTLDRRFFIGAQDNITITIMPIGEDGKIMPQKKPARYTSSRT
jgi:hypothetical protein